MHNCSDKNLPLAEGKKPGFAPNIIFYPYDDKFLRNTRLSLSLVGGIGIFVYMIAKLPIGALVVSLFAFVFIVPIEIFIWIYRSQRKMVFLTGNLIAAKIVGKKFSMLGPLHSLVVEYCPKGCVRRKACLVPHKIWLQHRVGDIVQIIYKENKGDILLIGKIAKIIDAK